MGCIETATLIAVEECIDSRLLSVKQKTYVKWKKWQQLFITEVRIACESSKKMVRLEQSERHTRDEIVPAVRENSRAQTATKIRK